MIPSQIHYPSALRRAQGETATVRAALRKAMEEIERLTGLLDEAEVIAGELAKGLAARARLEEELRKQIRVMSAELRGRV